MVNAELPFSSKPRATKHDFLRMKSEIIRKNPAFRGTPPAFGRSRSDTIPVFLMKNRNLCS